MCSILYIMPEKAWALSFSKSLLASTARNSPQKIYYGCLLQIRQLLENAVTWAERTVKSEASAPVTVENSH